VIACDFVAKAEDSEGRVQVVCVRCGRSVRVNASHVGRVYANCRNQTAAVAQAPKAGPGTELSKILKRFGIEPTPTCKCRAKAAQMDAWGCDECSKPERIDEVVAVMREEAKARGLPFVDMAGRVLVKRAISNARKAEARRAKEAQPAESGPA
jgi:hypothetical protein